MMVSEEQLASLEETYNDLENGKKWTMIYHEIRTDAQQFGFSDKIAKQMVNRPLNRYRDVNPYDHSRVQLAGDGAAGLVSDYINASLVPVESVRRCYILAQGPLPNTAGHFWLMVWQQRCGAIVMLNKTIEKNQIKCHQYWPLDSRTMVLEDVGLSVERLSQVDFSYYSVTTLKLTELCGGESRDVLHFHYTTWPDFGIPQSPLAFLAFLRAVRRSGALDQDLHGPPVVHCSAGIGRSGTFCLVDSYLLMLERGCVDGRTIQSLLVTMRRYRMGLIQTAEQLKFSFLAIVEGARALHQHGSLCGLSNGSGSSDPAVVGETSPAKRKRQNSADVEAVVGGALEVSDVPPPPPPPRAESLSPTSATAASEAAKLSQLETPDIYNGENTTELCSSADDSSATRRRRGPAATAAQTDGEATPPPLPPRRNASGPAQSNHQLHQQLQQPIADMNQGVSQLHQRRARKQELEQRVVEMRQRQLEHELWQRRRDQLKPLAYTAAALSAAVLAYLLATRCM